MIRRPVPRRLIRAATVLVWAAIGLTCGSRPVQPSVDPDADLYGALVPSEEEFADYPKALPASILTGQTSIPTQFQIPSASLPPVQAQGTPQQLGYPGSCEVWAAAYALGSYTANITNQKPISDLDNTVSAAFVYMWVLHQQKPPRACGGGTSPATSLNYLTAQSAPSLATVGYQPNCPGYLDNININQQYSTDLKIGGWSAVPKSTDPAQKLDAIKGYVADSRIVEITFVVPFGFDKYDPNANNGVFNAAPSCPSVSPACHQYGSIACSASATTKSGCAQHGVAIVGYDDTRPNPQTGQPGAVKIMNSFGPAWGANGFIWMSYATVESALLGGGIIADPPPVKGAGTAITDAFQRVERRGAAVTAAHLVFRARLESPIAHGAVTIAAPDGKTAVQQLSHPFWSGPLYLSRRDGRSFFSGLYTVRVQGTRVGGDPVDLSLQGRIEAEPGGGPAATFSEGMTGTNGQAVR